MGYYTSSLLCMPVKNSYEEIIAVAQVNNKNPDKDDGHFTSMDEKVNNIILESGCKHTPTVCLDAELLRETNTVFKSDLCSGAAVGRLPCIRMYLNTLKTFPTPSADAVVMRNLYKSGNHNIRVCVHITWNIMYPIRGLLPLLVSDWKSLW